MRICIRLSIVLLIRIHPSFKPEVYKAFTVLAENNKNFTQLSLKTFTDVLYQVKRHENCAFFHVI